MGNASSSDYPDANEAQKLEKEADFGIGSQWQKNKLRHLEIKEKYIKCQQSIQELDHLLPDGQPVNKPLALRAKSELLKVDHNDPEIEHYLRIFDDPPHHSPQTHMLVYQDSKILKQNPKAEKYIFQNQQLLESRAMLSSSEKADAP